MAKSSAALKFECILVSARARYLRHANSMPPSEAQANALETILARRAIYPHHMIFRPDDPRLQAEMWYSAVAMPRGGNLRR